MTDARLNSRARSHAVVALVRAHREEFAVLHRAARLSLGLPADLPGPPTVPIDPGELARMWAAGETRDKIAAHFGCHINTISARVRALGLPARPKGWNMKAKAQR